eukprot:m.247258 g.247258  ORF g.247258 m.247258 type:complete len:455 (+) comp19494_c0_seq2:318-1682(+)
MVHLLVFCFMVQVLPIESAWGAGAPVLVNGSRSTMSAAASSIRIAFGSCNKAREDVVNPLWDDIIDSHPDVWVWGGDNVYVDKHLIDILPISPRIKGTTTTILQEYEFMRNNSEYQRFVDTGVAIIGTWDDHDYGLNDAGKDLDIKHETRTATLDFLEHKQPSTLVHPERRTRDDGIYTSHTFTTKDNRSVGVVLLDSRWNKDPTTILGAQQWSWLADTLQEHQDAGVLVTFILSSIQVLADFRPIGEYWGRHPAERNRLISTIARFNHSIVLLSGDVHLAAINQATCSEVAKEDPWTLLEVTSSGMTHSWEKPFWRKYIMLASHWLLPWNHNTDWALPLNFGVLDVDLETEQLRVQVLGDGGVFMIDKTFDLKSLRPNGSTARDSDVECKPILGVPAHASVLVQCLLFLGMCAAPPLLVASVVFYAAMRVRKFWVNRLKRRSSLDLETLKKHV